MHLISLWEEIVFHGPPAVKQLLHNNNNNSHLSHHTHLISAEFLTDMLQSIKDPKTHRLTKQFDTVLLVKCNFTEDILQSY